MIDTRTLMQSVCLAAIVVAAGTCPRQPPPSRPIAPASATPVPGPMPDILQKYAPVTADRLKKPEDSNWLMIRGTYEGWGYSPLEQITTANVKQLRRCGASRPAVEGHEAPPIVNNGVMFVATPRNQVLALDAKTGDLLWRYKRELPEDCAAAPHQPRRRAVRRQGLLAAQDARAGRARRQDRQGACGDQPVDDYTQGYYMTMAPLVVDGKVMVGVSGGEFGVRGFVAAFDAETGKRALEDLHRSRPGRARPTPGRATLEARRRLRSG